MGQTPNGHGTVTKGQEMAPSRFSLRKGLSNGSLKDELLIASQYAYNAN